MNPSDPRTEGSSPESSPAVRLGYESIPPIPVSVRRPKWVYFLVLVYLLVLSSLLLLPAWIRISGADWGPTLAAVAFVSGLTICGVSLMVLPARTIRQRPITCRSIWFPIFGSGLLAGCLLLGAGFAIDELFNGSGNTPNDSFLWVILISSLIVWAGWSIIFFQIAFRSGPDSIGLKLHRTLIAGSVLELLVAVPSHVVVRRRSDCCAGVETGLGICIGVTIMVIALGPSVLFLFYKRYKQISRPNNTGRK